MPFTMRYPVVFLAIGALGCTSEPYRSPVGPAYADDGPFGDVASDAQEAWPNKPNVTPVTALEVLEACAAVARCGGTPWSGVSDPVWAAGQCIQVVGHSGERAIPMSWAMSGWNERVELFVHCAIDGQDDCAAVAECLTERASTIYCEEDGCRATYQYDVTCDGTVAHLATSAEPIVRDCARAFAVCDPDSHTGCTDRPFSLCPEDAAPADRCDGNIRLGCDGKGQVSYHDCERLTGVCEQAGGVGDCAYGGDGGCTTDYDAFCAGTDLVGCVGGRHVTVSAPDICGGG